MQLHNLSRTGKILLTAFLSLAIILPLLALVPRYLNWEIREHTKASVESYQASISASFSE